MTSRGEYLVGTSFNPSGSSTVDKIKALAAELIDVCDELMEDRDRPGAREAALAITNIEQGAMWAVKAATKGPWEK